MDDRSSKVSRWGGAKSWKNDGLQVTSTNKRRGMTVKWRQPNERIVGQVTGKRWLCGEKVFDDLFGKKCHHMVGWMAREYNTTENNLGLVTDYLCCPSSQVSTHDLLLTGIDAFECTKRLSSTGDDNDKKSICRRCVGWYTDGTDWSHSWREQGTMEWLPWLWNCPHEAESCLPCCSARMLRLEFLPPSYKKSALMASRGVSFASHWPSHSSLPDWLRMMRRYTWHSAERVRVVSESFVCEGMGSRECVRESNRERNGEYAYSKGVRCWRSLPRNCAVMFNKTR